MVKEIQYKTQIPAYGMREAPTSHLGFEQWPGVSSSCSYLSWSGLWSWIAIYLVLGPGLLVKQKENTMSGEYRGGGT